MTECRTWSQRRRLLMCAGWSYRMSGYGNGVQWESRNRLASMTDDEFRELLGLNEEAEK